MCSFECKSCAKILTGHFDLLRHRQKNRQCRALQTRITLCITTSVDVPIVVTRYDVLSPESDTATTFFDRTSRISPKRQASIPPLGELFGETVPFEEVIASGEVFPPQLVTPPIKGATAPREQIALEEATAPEEETGPGEKTAPEEETAREDETSREEETAREKETAPEQKQKIPEIELPYLDSFKWGSHNRSKVGAKKFWI